MVDTQGPWAPGLAQARQAPRACKGTYPGREAIGEPVSIPPHHPCGGHLFLSGRLCPRGHNANCRETERPVGLMDRGRRRDGAGLLLGKARSQVSPPHLPWRRQAGGRGGGVGEHSVGMSELCPALLSGPEPYFSGKMGQEVPLLRAVCLSASASCRVGTRLMSLDVSGGEVWWDSLLLGS